MLQSVVEQVECNPRSIKRLVNLLQIISEMAKLKPLTGVSPATAIAHWKGGREWQSFSEKAVLWVFMAQSFTFRLSALVQVLLDFEQKRDFNDKKVSNQLSLGFKYKKCSVSKATKIHNGDHIEDVDSMSIFLFYQKYVEKFIRVFRHSDRLSRVDKDPEEFALLLLECDAIDVKCEDILGPRMKPTASGDASSTKKTQRNKDFSLLSYSFNLDPAMRLEVR